MSGDRLDLETCQRSRGRWIEEAKTQRREVKRLREELDILLAANSPHRRRDMKNDRLAQIMSAIEFRREDPEGPQIVTLTTETAEALVEIAKAARELCDGGQDLAAPFAALRSALARLDRSSSDGTADSGAAEENA